MKIQLHEYDRAFSFDLKAESVEDCALLTRLTMNAKKESPSIGVFANNDYTFNGYVSIGKRSDSTSRIRRSK